MNLAALVPAAGEGMRLGLGPKAFVDVGGRSLLERAVAALAPFVDYVVVAVGPAMSARAMELLGAGARVVAGGESRQASVLAMLRATDAELVLVHDAARPFVPAAVIRALVGAVSRTGAATAAAPVSDTLVWANSGKALDRSRVRAVQTPQGFRRALLLEAHEQALTEAYQGTDDAALVRRLGHPVELVPGSPWLLKVTSREDLALAEALAVRWDSAKEMHAGA